MWSNYGKNGGSDLEYGGRAGLLYPTMEESPELRWSFIRKIYSILTIQLILTAIVATIVVTVKPITVFFNTTTSGHVLYIVLIIFPIIGKEKLIFFVVCFIIFRLLFVYLFKFGRVYNFFWFGFYFSIGDCLIDLHNKSIKFALHYYNYYWICC